MNEVPEGEPRSDKTDATETEPLDGSLVWLHTALAHQQHCGMNARDPFRSSSVSVHFINTATHPYAMLAPHASSRRSTGLSSGVGEDSDSDSEPASLGASQSFQ
jgi:hypothetical protein